MCNHTKITITKGNRTEIYKKKAEIKNLRNLENTY
jgi:hypothetical protein